MRVTVLGQDSKGLIRLDRVVGENIRKKLNSVKWLLWQGSSLAGGLPFDKGGLGGFHCQLCSVRMFCGLI
jgi:hypothetical protein